MLIVKSLLFFLSKRNSHVLTPKSQLSKALFTLYSFYMSDSAMSVIFIHTEHSCAWKHSAIFSLKSEDLEK